MTIDKDLQKMKTVLQLMEAVEVPDDYERCSVCGKWHPIESFNNDNSKHRTRTNCSDCYHMPFEDMKVLGEKTTEIHNSKEYKNASTKLSNYLHLKDNVLTKQELIGSAQRVLQMLSELPDDALFTECSYDDYDGTTFNKPYFRIDFIKPDCDYPYEYPKEIDGKQILYRNGS